MRIANPAMNAETFTGYSGVATRQDVMTVHGTVNKTGILLVLVVASAAWPWSVWLKTGDPAVMMPWAMGGALAGLVLALVTAFKKEVAHVTAPLYALAEGLFIGAISAWMEHMFPNIVMQAVALTFGTAGCLLIAYKAGVVRATDRFKRGVMAATGGIFAIYMLTWVLSFFGVHMPYIHEGGAIGIGFSVAVVVVAALNLVLNFDFIEQGARAGAPKRLEWYGAFGLVVTLVWLYIEILRLLAKIAASRD